MKEGLTVTKKKKDATERALEEAWAHYRASLEHIVKKAWLDGMRFGLESMGEAAAEVFDDK